MSHTHYRNYKTQISNSSTMKVILNKQHYYVIKRILYIDNNNKIINIGRHIQLILDICIYYDYKTISIKYQYTICSFKMEAITVILADHYNTVFKI